MDSCLCYVCTGSLKFSCVFLLLHIVESCDGRCNQHKDDTPADSCYCDDECLGSEDCCDDYEALCEDGNTMDNNGLNKSEFQFFYNNVFLIAGSLEAAYSLNWGAKEIWGKGGGETLALL